MLFLAERRADRWRDQGNMMNIVESLPNRVRVIEHLLIPLSDGCRLAARISSMVVRMRPSLTCGS